MITFWIVLLVVGLVWMGLMALGLRRLSREKAAKADQMAELNRSRLDTFSTFSSIRPGAVSKEVSAEDQADAAELFFNAPTSAVRSGR